MKRLSVKFQDQVIDQTQGPDDELALWLEGNLAVNKYPEGYEVEYYDLAPELAAQAVANKLKQDKVKAAKTYLKNRQLSGTTVATMRTELNEVLAALSELLAE
jgi:hypothetical protein